MEKNLRVVVVDDHTLFRTGIVSLLKQQNNMDVVGEGKNGEEAITLVQDLLPDLVLMDIKMPKMDGIHATEKLKEEFPDLNIIILTVCEEDEHLFSAIKAGAKGYLLKNVEPDQLIKSLKCLAKGEAVISRSMATRIITEFTQMAKKVGPKPQGKLETLSQREKEILKLLSTGMSNREMANELCIAENTIKIHLRHILKKLHLSNRLQAALYVLKEGADL